MTKAIDCPLTSRLRKNTQGQISTPLLHRRYPSRFRSKTKESASTSNTGVGIAL